MTAMLSGGLSLASGLFGMFGGLAGANRAASPGIAPAFYRISGEQQQKAYTSEAQNYSTQAGLAYEESLRDAAQKARQVETFKQRQALEYASSGVSLQGSPLAVLTETQILGNMEVDAIKSRGRAVSGLLEQQGLQMLRQGSAAAFGGFAQALQADFEAKNKSATIRSQAFQTGISGLQGFLSAFSSGGGGGGGAGMYTGPAAAGGYP